MGDTGARPAGGPWAPRLVTAARFVALLYVLVVVFLVLAAVIPAVIAQWQPLAVVSGSMQPALRPGTIVLTEPATPDRHYSAPSIVTFHDPSRPGGLVTHRVVDTKAHPSGAVSYATQGDANQVRDSARIPHSEVVGAVRMVVPFIGLPALWVHDGNLRTLAAFTGTSLLAAGALTTRGRP